MVDGPNPSCAADGHSSYINSIICGMPMHLESSSDAAGSYSYSTNGLMRYCIWLNS